MAFPLYLPFLIGSGFFYGAAKTLSHAIKRGKPYVNFADNRIVETI